MRLPANHDEIAGVVAQRNVVLDLRVLCGTSHAEANVPVRGSVKRAPCGLNGRLPDVWVYFASTLAVTTAHHALTSERIGVLSHPAFSYPAPTSTLPASAPAFEHVPASSWA